MYTLVFLLSDVASKGRHARALQYEADAADLNGLAYVLHVEKAGYQFVELDAEGYTHAMRLGVSVVTHWTDVRSVSIRKVADDGSLGEAVRILDYRDADGYEDTDHSDILVDPAAAA